MGVWLEIARSLNRWESVLIAVGGLMAVALYALLVQGLGPTEEQFWIKLSRGGLPAMLFVVGTTNYPNNLGWVVILYVLSGAPFLFFTGEGLGLFTN
ncbi:MAG: hypothetical protein ABEI52_07525 [Halobacteriaceae archaeon]